MYYGKARAKRLSISVALLLLVAAESAWGAMADYCSTPPFMSNNVPPNVLIVLDNSGSMHGQAYAGSFNPAQFVGGHYYGYFEPTSNYRYNGNQWEVTTADFSTATVSNPIASGDFLNWATMRRIDVAKKLLIGGKANPRSPQPSQTVKLNGENSPSPSRDFDKEFDNTAAPGVVAPFLGSYSYEMRGDKLYATPLFSGTSTLHPTGDISVTSWSVTGAGSAWSAVDEATSDGSSTYIRNTSNTNPALFDYNYSASKTGVITNVAIKVVARKSSSSTMRIQGALRVGGTNYLSSYSNLSTSYSTYTFTFANNPATGAPWQWSDIKTDGVGALGAFGVQPYTSPTGSNYPLVTQVILVVSTSVPSGGGYTTIIDQGMKKAEGIIDTLSDNARFGLAFYNNGEGFEKSTPTANGKYDGGYVANYVDFGAPVNMVTSIHNMSPDTWTPLAETLYEMVRYFRQENPYYSGNAPADYQVGQNYDPYYFQYSKWPGSNLPDQYVRCAKSFILMLTDGESTKDKNIPDALRDFDGDGKDGTFGSDQSSDYLDDIALWARTTDHRDTLIGDQNIYVYPVFMFGRGSQLLKDAAINGGFNDLNGDKKPGPDSREYLRDSNGNGTIDANDLPLTYFEGDDGYELEASITAAIESIMDRAASGTAVSVLTTSSRGVGSMVQAYFLPVRQDGNREVTWTGYTQNLWIDPKDNLREDSVNDFKLVPNSVDNGGDHVVKLYFDQEVTETKAALFTTKEDGSGGTLAECKPSGTKPFGKIQYLWEAGRKLALRNPDDRTLFTSKKVVSSSGTTVIGNSTFSVTNVLSDATLSAALDPDATYTADNIVRYIRGESLEASSSSFRDRRITVDDGLHVWKLGDIISSTPKVFANTPQNTYHIDYADSTYYKYISGSSYKQRSSVAFVGANDGVLHAFRVGYLKDTGLMAGVKAMFQDAFGDDNQNTLGKEIWGYIPFNAFPYLKYLANPDYCHIYYNDLSVRLVDASLGGAANPNPADTKTLESWKTVLIGGMRFGGACNGGSPAPPAGVTNVGYSAYYAIDITDPENPVPLWEFSDADLGYASTYPAVLRTGESGKNGSWYVVFGSGSKQLPKGTTDIARSSTGYVFILDLKTGQLVKKLDLGHNAIVGDLLAIDKDKDYTSEKVYFGTAYRNGTAWAGKVMGLDIPADVTTLCGAGVSRTYADCTSGAKPLKILLADNYPFTASPDAAKDVYGDTWVYIGSGKYLSDVDETDTAGQLFLGLKDVTTGITYPLAVANLDDRTSTQTTGSVRETAKVCGYDSSTGKFGFQTVVTAIKPDPQTLTNGGKGWRVMLNSGERVITRPLAVGGLVDFLTYKPSADPCSFGGESYLYAVDYMLGVAPSNIAIQAKGTTAGVTSGNVTVAKGILIGPGAPPTGEAIIIPPPKEGQEQLKKKIQIATGVIVEAENNPVFSVISKVVHWLKK